MQVVPWWAHKCPDAWQKIAEMRWCNTEWREASFGARERRLLMGGPAHHQGSSSMACYKKHLVRQRANNIFDIADLYSFAFFL